MLVESFHPGTALVLLLFILSLLLSLFPLVLFRNHPVALRFLDAWPIPPLRVLLALRHARPESGPHPLLRGLVLVLGRERLDVTLPDGAL